MKTDKLMDIWWTWRGSEDKTVDSGVLTLHEPDAEIEIPLSSFQVARALVTTIDTRSKRKFAEGQRSVARDVSLALKAHTRERLS